MFSCRQITVHSVPSVNLLVTNVYARTRAFVFGFGALRFAERRSWRRDPGRGRGPGFSVSLTLTLSRVSGLNQWRRHWVGLHTPTFCSSPPNLHTTLKTNHFCTTALSGSVRFIDPYFWLGGGDFVRCPFRRRTSSKIGGNVRATLVVNFPVYFVSVNCYYYMLFAIGFEWNRLVA